MKFYDITRELFSAPVYPGDPEPKYERLQEMSKGAVCNLTYLKMCVHNGTHMDAPRHFLENGKSIHELPLSQVLGRCAVVEYDGVLGGDKAEELVAGHKKVLWKGAPVITAEAAQAFVRCGLELVGVEGMTVGSKGAPERVHKILLGAEVAILESLCLEEVEPGEYFLCAQPLKLAGCDGAPCRAVLIETA